MWKNDAWNKLFEKTEQFDTLNDIWNSKCPEDLFHIHNKLKRICENIKNQELQKCMCMLGNLQKYLKTALKRKNTDSHSSDEETSSNETIFDEIHMEESHPNKRFKRSHE